MPLTLNCVDACEPSAATVAIGNARNAGLLAIQILATHDSALLEKVQQYRRSLAQIVIEKQAKLEEKGYKRYLDEEMRL